ncbi:hypothetical protein [Argonema galeatum]|uniref:hypothetical protein n=1 Tax=Argonema galeatum TaxID=2942762 RepID=UPI00201140AF|nr:hypothetical protein [Argonema galeatum]MCL1465093.1 hypothetical protein [Argonema galeatum A003/A1]
MLKIDHPQVYIYSYQLSREPETEVHSIWTWANNIWKDFSHEINPISSKENLSNILSKPKKFNYSDQIQGSFRFCSLDDSVGILARIGSPETKENKYLEITELNQFNDKNLILPESYQNWLGQTIFITYKLSIYITPTTEQLKELADECVKSLLPASHRPPFYRTTKLFDRPIFEYSDLKGQLQIFVYLIDDTTEKKLGSILQPLFELFFHRHKITKAFIDSRTNYNLAHEFYTIIENTIENLKLETDTNNEQINKTNEDLRGLKTQVKQLLYDSLNYERTLQTLEELDNLISIHIYNYQQKLSEICEKCQLQPEHLTTFSLFIEKTSPYFQRQIKGDLGYFQHGTNLIDTAIASIRGIVEIEQAEIDRLWQNQEKDRDRQLQNTIAVVGVGIGFAGVAATASPYIFEAKPNQKLTINPVHLQPSFGLNPPHHLTLSLLFSLGAGLVGVTIAARVMRHIQQHPKSPIARTVNFILGNSQAQENKVPPS